MDHADDHRLEAPTGITVTDSGNLLIADGGNRRVTEYGPDGTYLRHEYAPSGSVNSASRPVGSFAKMVSNGYIVRPGPGGQ